MAGVFVWVYHKDIFLYRELLLLACIFPPVLQDGEVKKYDTPENLFLRKFVPHRFGSGAGVAHIKQFLTGYQKRNRCARQEHSTRGPFPAPAKTRGPEAVETGGISSGQEKFIFPADGTASQNTA